MSGILEGISSNIWGTGTVLLLISTGILFTVRLRFIQFRTFPYLLKKRSGSSAGGISQRKTVCMALGAAMGTGNITGAASAAAMGGPGALFWMWVSAFFGMALVYAENSLSARYSSDEASGPMAYISAGLGSRKLAVAFALLCICASAGMGGMVQVSAFLESTCSYTGIHPMLLALPIFLLILIVTSGGAKRIGSAAQALIPAVSVLYGISCLTVIAMNHERLPEVISSVFNGAFGIRPAGCGIAGYGISRAVSAGIRRGIFSNEAGLGTSPILHSAAKSSDAQLQGMWSMAEVFFDTIICCTLSFLTVLCGSEDMTVENAFRSSLGAPGSIILMFSVGVFAFCTVIGQYYCCSAAYSFISGKHGSRFLSALFSAAASLGAVMAVRTVWTLSDIFNGLMIFPNLAALLLLRKEVMYNPQDTVNNQR